MRVRARCMPHLFSSVALEYLKQTQRNGRPSCHYGIKNNEHNKNKGTKLVRMNEGMCSTVSDPGRVLLFNKITFSLPDNMRLTWSCVLIDEKGTTCATMWENLTA